MTRRLLSIGHSYAIDVNRRLPQELQAQSEGRWEVTIAAPDNFQGRNDLRRQVLSVGPDEPVEVCPIPVRWTGRVHVFSYGRELRRLIREGGFDLIHAWEEPYIYAGWQIARAAKGVAPVVFTTCQNKSKRYPPPFSYFEQYCVNSMAGWTFIGSLVEQTLLSRPGYADKPCSYLPLGVDSKLFHVDHEAGRQVREGLGWDDTPVVGYLGRLVPEKGIRVLQKALERVTAPWRLMLIGDGSLAPEVRAWATRFPGRVAICDKVTHAGVPRYLNAADMLVAPSLTAPNWREQFGRMLVEAFACGVPVIGSDSGEIPYVIGDAGIVTPEDNVDALAAAIQRLLTNSDERSWLAAAGLSRVQEKYTWPKIARDTIGFFDQLAQ